MPAPLLLPKPARLTLAEGTFNLTGDLTIGADGAAREEAWYLQESLARALGKWPAVSEAGDGAIALRLDETAEVGAEGYRLNITPDRIELTARDRAGLFYGTQTLLQLLPADVYRRASVPGVIWTVPCGEIVDAPRFSWRGLMLDPSRHFIPKGDVLRFLDAMALHKLNRMHFHLCDDQGWRVEIKRYPRLTEHAAWRSGTLLGHARKPPHEFDTIPHGGYYTQDDLREIVAYAAARHITVIPEIEMPGHARAWIAAYPEVGCFPDRQRGMEPWGMWGISPEVIAPRPEVVEMARNILLEVMEIFPSEWIHIGGDEAPRQHWEESEEIAKLVKSLGLPDVHHLQAWFTGRINEFLKSHGRKLLGWDEILEGGLAEGATVMSWRGEKGGIAAANAGHEVVMTPSPWVYLDNCQGPQDEERIGIGGYVSLAKTYRYDPLPEAIPAEQHHLILGLQGNLWSEYMPHPRHVEYMAFPRAAAIAEIDWSPQAGRDLGDFLHRFHHHQDRLRAMGLNFRPLSRRPVRAEGGEFIAGADTAMLHGNAIRRHEDHLGDWTSDEAFATWELIVENPAEVEVVLTWSAEVAGAEVAVDVAGDTLTWTVSATDESRAEVIGRVALPAGRQLLAVRPLKLAAEQVMRLRAVTLRPPAV